MFLDSTCDRGPYSDKPGAKKDSDMRREHYFLKFDMGHGKNVVTKTCDIAVFKKMDKNFGIPL